MIFYCSMESDPKPSSNDKVPSFFSEGDKTTENLHFEKIKKNDSIESSSKTTKQSSKLTIHWPSLGIGAVIAVACIFFGIMMANMVDTESTQILDEITINEIGSIKKPTFSSFTDNASPILGDENAPLTLIEFGDYQCTYCKKFFRETVESILINYVETGKVKMLFKDFIVVDGAVGGNDSMNAANAAHCANDQGMFWQFHSTLYNNWAGEGTGWISSEQLNKFANTLELDMNEFSNCVSELKWKKLVNASHDDAVALGVTATPTFFVIDENRNVLKITGAQHYDVFKEVFDSALEK